MGVESASSFMVVCKQLYGSVQAAACCMVVCKWLPCECL